MIIEKDYGDLAGAFRVAHAIVALRSVDRRHSGVPLETRGAIARYDSDRDILELHGAAKVPHRNREQIAKLLGRSLNSVHLFEGHVGGGFGVRGELYPEDVLVCLAALRLGRPVKWIEDRHEHFVATNHSRQQRHKVRAAIDVQGRILALEDVFFHYQGAYVRTHGARVVDLTAGMLPGPYRIPAYRAAGHYRLTNKTPAATYRSPGRYESTFVRERLLDAIAERIGIDRIEVRRRNMIDNRNAVRAATAHAWRRRDPGFGRLCRAARQDLASPRMEQTAGKPDKAPQRGRSGRRRSCHVCGEERAWSKRRRADCGRTDRPCGSRHRRRIAWPGF
jgi:CO/xanthine dehydrogenase Mo-binding subunit